MQLAAQPIKRKNFAILLLSFTLQFILSSCSSIPDVANQESQWYSPVDADEISSFTLSGKMALRIEKKAAQVHFFWREMPGSAKILLENSLGGLVAKVERQGNTFRVSDIAHPDNERDLLKKQFNSLEAIIISLLASPGKKINLPEGFIQDLLLLRNQEYWLDWKSKQANELSWQVYNKDDQKPRQGELPRFIDIHIPPYGMRIFIESWHKVG